MNFAGSERESFLVDVEGWATDTGGDNPGIAAVNVIVKNIEHREFFCGGPGCAGGAIGEFTSFRPKYTKVDAHLDAPGATSTRFSISFPVYDHPHKYAISAYAIDRDGKADRTKARIAAGRLVRSGRDFKPLPCSTDVSLRHRHSDQRRSGTATPGQGDSPCSLPTVSFRFVDAGCVRWRWSPRWPWPRR